jgi:transcriptional regulator with XRE-family HTH domain
MKHSEQMQAMASIGIDRDLLASFLRNKMNEERLSLRKAAELMGSSPATLSRLLNGSGSDYVADTSTLAAAASWLNKSMSDFEVNKRPSESSLAEVEMHLHALPKITEADARAMMAVITALYDEKLRRSADEQ